ncbi:hypothetical protein [Heyndrickxia acidicola]|uniref:Uncharacterized protein n=1 Tax=Heyndrickxia acidicola TaxID=209389 RepID=A0ABU6MLD0_9BACI|nr:hypothetical protein [Heyndrickxia acidicola]MED1205489.1 hypothetical protein [Heyndrickxia acidicola]
MIHAQPITQLKSKIRTQSKVDSSGRHETPAGKAGMGRPRRSLRRGGSRPPRGKRVPVEEINLQYDTCTTNYSVKA